MSHDDIARVRADFDALKAKLKASADQLDPERYDQVTARLVALDEVAIRDVIAKRKGSHKIARLMADIEQRLDVAEGRERERT